MKCGIKIAAAITCVNGNGEELYTGGGDLYVQIPPYCRDDKQLTDIHLETQARIQSVTIMRRLMQDNPNYLPQAFKDAFHADDWQLKARVFVIYPEEKEST